MKHLVGILILSLLVLSGCTGRYSDDLLAVERVMQDDPARGYEMLQKIPAESVDSKADKALYGLLLTMLEIKNRLPAESDSLITDAIHHFWKADDKPHLADGYIYKGRWQYQTSDAQGAMKSAISALELSKKLSDTLRLARSYELIADIYHYAAYFDKAIENRRVAAIFYEKSGMKLNYYYSLVGTSEEYSSSGNYAGAIELLDSVKFMIDDSISTKWLRGYHLESYISPLFYLKEYDKVKDIIKAVENNGISELSLNHCRMMSMIYSRKAKIDSALIYLSLCEQRCITPTDSILLVDAQLELARQLRNYEDVISLTKSLDKLQNRAVWKMLEESVDDAQAEYYKTQNGIFELKERRTRFVAISVGVFSLFLFLILYLIFKNRLYKRRILIDEKFAEIRELTGKMKIIEQERAKLSSIISEGDNKIQSLSEVLDERSSELCHVSEIVDKLFKNQFVVLDRLCDEYYEKKDSEKVRVSLYAELENIVHEMQSQKSLAELVSGVNECRNGIIDKLRSELPSLSESDIQFMALLYAEFSPRSICLFMGYKLSNFYAKRKRLKARIEASDAPNKELFLSIMM